MQIDAVSQADVAEAATMSHAEAIDFLAAKAGITDKSIAELAVDARLWDQSVTSHRHRMLADWLDIENLYTHTPDIPLPLRKG